MRHTYASLEKNNTGRGVEGRREPGDAEEKERYSLRGGKGHQERKDGKRGFLPRREGALVAGDRPQRRNMAFERKGGQPSGAKRGGEEKTLIRYWGEEKKRSVLSSTRKKRTADRAKEREVDAVS